MKYQVQENCLTIFLPREVDHHSADEIRKESDYLIERNHIRYVIFDFRETEFMDSSGIGIIAGRYKKIQCLNGKVYILNAGKQVNRILLLSGLQKYVIIMK